MSRRVPKEVLVLAWIMMTPMASHAEPCRLDSKLLLQDVAIRLSRYGQITDATGTKPSFEVVTIKPVHDNRISVSAGSRNTASFSNITIRSLIATAYNLGFLSDEGVLGGPKWIDTERYDLHARIPDAVFAEMQKMTPTEVQIQVRLMWQALLADRFGLKVHFETRQKPIYKLIVAKGGPKLRPTTEPLAVPGNPLRAEDKPGLTLHFETATIAEMTVRGETLNIWEHMPFLRLGRPIVNETGLKGRYDFTLRWAPDQPEGPGSNGFARPDESDLPPLFTALQEELGLKLVAAKGPVQVTVIDHIERPSEN